MKRSYFVAVFILLTACNQKKHPSVPLIKFRQAFLDSIINKSDTFYTKPYKRPDFVTADYYRLKDSSLVQVMRDSTKQVRQVLISRRNTRVYLAQYYANGQLMADLKTDEYGQFDGPAIYYYEDGSVQRKGNYAHGFSTGDWKEYDKNGEMKIVKFDAKGTRLN